MDEHICVIAVLEAFIVGIDVQPLSECDGGSIDVDFMSLQVLEQAFHRLRTYLDTQEWMLTSYVTEVVDVDA